MRVRLFGIDDCSKCLQLRKELSGSGILYYYIDADENSAQDLCDEEGVDEVPHVQVLNSRGETVWEHIGYIGVAVLKRVLSRTR